MIKKIFNDVCIIGLNGNIVCGVAQVSHVNKDISRTQIMKKNQERKIIMLSSSMLLNAK